jgi:hypothetical protein
MNMSLNKKQKTFLEALDIYLNQDAQLGLKGHDKDDLNDLERVNGLEFIHNDIYSKYRDKLFNAKLIYIGPILQAFNKAHSYKNFGSTTFNSAMEKELTAQAIDSSEIAKALDLADKLLEELRDGRDAWAEQDSGLNSDMDGIKEVSQPEQASEFDIIKTDLNKKNVKDIHDEFE